MAKRRTTTRRARPVGTRRPAPQRCDRDRAATAAGGPPDLVYLQSLLDAIPTPIFFEDRAGRLLGCNRAFETFTGHPRARLVGATAFDLYPLDLAITHHEADLALFSTGLPQEYEQQLLTADGQTREVLVLKSPLTSPGGEVTGLVGSVVDLSEQKRAETWMRLNLVRLERAERLARLGHFDWDADTDTVMASDQLYHILGLTPGSPLTPARALASLHPDDRQAALATVADARDGRAVRPLDTRVVQAGGAVRRVRIETEIARDRAQRPLRVLGIVQDVTDAFEAAEALRQSREHFRSLVETTGDLVWEVDPAGRYTYLSPQARDLLGYAPEALVGRFPFELMPAQEAACLAPQVLSMMERRERIVALEHPAVHRDGRTVVLETNGVPVLGPDGGFQGYRGIDRDISERKQIEEELRRQVQRNELILQTAIDGFLVTDHDGRLLTVNPAYADTVGFPEFELLGMTLDDLDVGLGPDAMRALLARIASDGHDRFETRHRRKDGDPVDLDVSIHYARIGRESFYFVFARDITERLRGEREMRLAKETAEAARRKLEEANARLEEAVTETRELAQKAEVANAAKSEFLANMSHEIRTPMNAVIGMAGLLIDTTLSTEQREFAETIRGAADALLTILNDILDYSKIEAGKIDLEVVDFDLHAVVDDTIEMLAVKAQEKGLDLWCHIDPHVPAWLRGDPGRLRQVLINLVGNAVKFTAAGEVAVHVSLVHEDETGAGVHVAVRDTGIGIPPDRMDRLFRSFSQIDPSSTRRYGGTGLGLVISKRLVELMGGEIGVESGSGRGSTFWFTAGLDRPVAARPPTLQTWDPRGCRILVADAHAGSRSALADLLVSWGCEVTETDSALEAVDRLRTAAAAGAPFAAALVDHELDESSGLALGPATGTVAGPGGPTTLVRLVPWGRRLDRDRLAAAGFTAAITKPVKRADLRGRLASLATGRPTDPPPTAGAHARAARPDLRRRRILVADDNVVNQKVAVRVLEKMGFRADAVGNGREAVDASRLAPYDVVLMDVQMPEMDGFEATAAIRARESREGGHLPIVAMTAHAMKGDRERCLEAGMDDYVSKPVQPADLLAAIERVCPDSAPVTRP